ncbi:MAG: RNA polymerase sigma-70 factor (ECF subfamily) [Arenicella sp.]|jgi:RNA polymerase sigma-70 factor (ECF subfamily)
MGNSMNDKITIEFLKYRRVISSLLSKIRPSASYQDIEDILQDTYINTYQSSLKQEIRFPKAFMVKTAIRLANRQISVAQRMDCDVDIEQRPNQSLSYYDASDFCSQTEDEVFSRKDFSFLCEAVNELPEQCSRVFVLKKVYGLSQREIAEKLDISESTVEKHVAKGLRRIMQAYHQQQGIDSESNLEKLQPNRKAMRGES